ncbi:MAG: proteasome subunit beta, partial [Jatrophihabitans sp.]
MQPAESVSLRHATARGSSSFRELVSSVAPDLLPHAHDSGETLPHATTIVAASYADGVVMAGDRRSTMGNLIAQRDIQKVFAADGFSLVGFAGVAGIGTQMIKLFQVELEHYEKIEGTPLSLAGKANRLATMIRGNLGAAMQGLTAVPLFAGYDTAVADSGTAGRIYGFDISGSLSQEQHYHAIGSGSLFAKSSLKKLWSPAMSRAEVVRA